MRLFLTAPLVVATLAGHVVAHRHATPVPTDQNTRRKSLGFGPDHPHAVFRSNPRQFQSSAFSPVDPSLDPLHIARIFIEDVLAVTSNGASYHIRKDSYTDKNTGVTHVYVRQLVNGLEVADGDININIKDGMVVSYGNSVRILTRASYFMSCDSFSLSFSSTRVPFRILSRTPVSATSTKRRVITSTSP